MPMGHTAAMKLKMLVKALSCSLSWAGGPLPQLSQNSSVSPMQLQLIQQTTWPPRCRPGEVLCTHVQLPRCVYVSTVTKHCGQQSTHMHPHVTLAY